MADESLQRVFEAWNNIPDTRRKDNFTLHCVQNVVTSDDRVLRFIVFTNLRMDVSLTLPNGILLEPWGGDWGTPFRESRPLSSEQIKQMRSGMYILEGQIRIDEEDVGKIGIAVLDAIDEVNRALAVLSLVAGCSYDWMPATKREWQGVKELLPTFSTGRTFTYEASQYCLELCNVLEQFSEHFRDDIYRSIDWFAQAVRSRSELNRFLSLWLSMESLANILKDRVQGKRKKE